MEKRAGEKTLVFCGSGFFGVKPGEEEILEDEGAIHSFVLETSKAVNPKLQPSEDTIWIIMTLTACKVFPCPLALTVRTVQGS